MVLQWKICETIFKVELTTVFFNTAEVPTRPHHALQKKSCK